MKTHLMPMRKIKVTKKLHQKHWKMFLVLLGICLALLILRWAAMVFA
ncbi:small membrane protein YniD [Yersinia ruckeri]